VPEELAASLEEVGFKKRVHGKDRLSLTTEVTEKHRGENSVFLCDLCGE
jgi:hypothetical protein